VLLADVTALQFGKAGAFNAPVVSFTFSRAEVSHAVRTGVALLGRGSCSGSEERLIGSARTAQVAAKILPVTGFALAVGSPICAQAQGPINRL
jgi:hypothetical protein